MPTEILYMAPDVVPYPKGSGTRIEATVRALASAGARVTLLTPALEGHDARLELDGVTQHTLALPPSSNVITRMLSFRDQCAAWLGRGRWDVVWFRSPWEGVPAVLSRPPTCVYEAHGFPSIELPSHDPTVHDDVELLDNLVAEENIVLRGATRVVTPSQTGRTWLLSRGVRSERVDVVPNAVDPELFAAVPPTREWEAHRPLRVLYLGTLAPWQGVGQLFEALSFLRGHVQVELTLVGTRKGTWVRDLRERASALRLRGRIRVLGPQLHHTLPVVLGDADVCAAPLVDGARNSVQGCCPIKILEYMAAARPILSTRLRPVMEIVRHGETAWLVEPSSPHALARGIQWLAENARQARALGVSAREEARLRWHPDVFRNRLGGVLEALSR